MPRLREALELLVDESLPLDRRLGKLRPRSGEPMVKGLGRSIIMAILQVVYRDKYGLLNNTAEAGMRQVGVWPGLTGSASGRERGRTTRIGNGVSGTGSHHPNRERGIGNGVAPPEGN